MSREQSNNLVSYQNKYMLNIGTNANKQDCNTLILYLKTSFSKHRFTFKSSLESIKADTARDPFSSCKDNSLYRELLNGASVFSLSVGKGNDSVKCQILPDEL